MTSKDHSGRTEDEEISLASAAALALSIGCLSVGLLGLWLPYPLPRPPSRPPAPIRADFVKVELTPARPVAKLSESLRPLPPPAPPRPLKIVAAPGNPSLLPLAARPPDLVVAPPPRLEPIVPPSIPLLLAVSQPPPLLAVAPPPDVEAKINPTGANFQTAPDRRAERAARPVEKKPAQEHPAPAFTLPSAAPPPAAERPRSQGGPVASRAETGPVEPEARALTFGEGEGRQAAPEYPPQALRERQKGTVLIGLDVDENGNVLSARVLKPCLWPLLNEAALRVVRRRWHFRVGTPRRYTVAIRFEIAE